MDEQKMQQSGDYPESKVSFLCNLFVFLFSLLYKVKKKRSTFTIFLSMRQWYMFLY